MCGDEAGISGADTAITAVRDFAVLDGNVFAVTNADAPQTIVIRIVNPYFIMELFIRRD